MDITINNGLAPLAAPTAANQIVPATTTTADSDPTATIPAPAMAAPALTAAPDMEAEENAIVEKLDGLVGNQVRFRVDLDTDRAVLQITDPETGEVVNSIPSEEMLAVMERLEEARCHLIDYAV